MLVTLARRLGLSFGTPPPAWRKALASRGVDARTLHALGRHAELADAWAQCPRLDFAVDIALRAGVERPLVIEGLLAVLEHAREWPHGQTSELERVMSALREAPRAEPPTFATALVSLVEAAPEVLTAHLALRDARRWRDRVSMQREADAYDEAHARAHRALAAVFRLKVSAEALRFALEGQRAHPYR